MARCKFICDTVTKSTYSEKVKMTAVYANEKNTEDNQFSSATPSGDFTLDVSNKALHGFFIPGEKYYLDISKASE